MITQAPLLSVVSSAIPYLSSWLTMIMQPSNIPINPSTNTAWLEIPHKIKVSNLLFIYFFHV